MSLEIVDRVLRNWEDPNYKGFDEFLASFWQIGDQPDNGLVYRTQLMLENCKYLKPNKKKVKYYDTTISGMRDFYKDHNIIEVIHDRVKLNAYKMRYPNPAITLEELVRYITPDTKYILDMSLLGCFSVLHMLINSNAYIVSTDSLYFEYNWYGKSFIDSKFPGRHLLISTNLYEAVDNKLLEKIHPDLKFDLMYMRLTKRKERVYSDIVMYKKFATEDTILILESVTPHKGWGIGQYVAMCQLINEGVLILLKHIPTDFDYQLNGLAVLKYNFDPTYVQKLELKDYIEMEINVPMMEFTRVVEEEVKNKTGLVNEYFVKTYREKFAKFGLEYDDFIKKIFKDEFGIVVG